jgi:hypothetical protein
MITAEEILDLQKRAPFHPFKLHLSDSREFEVEHPDQMLVFEGLVYLALKREEGKIPNRAERIAMVHITSLESVETS